MRTEETVVYDDDMIEELAYRDEVREKVERLFSAPEDAIFSAKGIADFYAVSVEAIQQTTDAYEDEFLSDGYLKHDGGYYSKRAVLRMGMLLCGSDVASEVCAKILSRH